MEDLTYEITIRKCRIKDLTPIQKKLVEAAGEARKRSRSYLSKYPVGAALLSKSGKIYCGSNNESADYTLSNHAEMLAVDKAVFDGEKKFIAIAVIAKGEPVTPCGLCRQKLSEYGTDIEVICANTAGDIMISNINSLLPFSFGSKFFLKK
ncbi:cytidine deaminase [Candidatus Woesearchaeota archaeon CG08_land_8_20_14_0_20_43_7]|nr:MAG: cytidine deaminase [Candidatus Woesearchaeota archaeon CG08_land_8_20_14_0_20_43_7]